MLMEHLFDIFMTVTNTQFCNYIQNLKDFHCLQTNTPESLFLQVQDYYNNIITKPGAVWLKTKKTKVAFTAGTPTTHQKPAGGSQAQTNQLSTASAPSNQGRQLGNGSGSRTPRQGDCTKPKEGEPHTRTNDRGYEEHWCSKYPNGGSWGNHLTDGHADWLKSFLKCKSKQKQKAAQNGQEQPENTATTNNQGSANQGKSTLGSMHCGSANTSLPSLSALFHCTCVTFDDSSDDDSV